MGKGGYSGGSSVVGWGSQGYRDRLKPKPRKSHPTRPFALGRLAANSVLKGKINRDDLIVFGRTADERAAFVETLRPIVAKIMSGDKDGPYHLAKSLNAMGITTAQGGIWGLRRVNVLLKLLEQGRA
ncbi:hypothetical protein JIX59_16535 [Brevundimonas diminuta]|nr:hypothetical protein [Brevundimonas diminuta]